MNDKFLNQITEFIFVEDKAEKIRYDFYMGSGFPQLAEEGKIISSRISTLYFAFRKI